MPRHRGIGAGARGAAAAPTVDALIAWGKPMHLNTGYPVQPDQQLPSLASLQHDLVGVHPEVGPDFAGPER